MVVLVILMQSNTTKFQLELLETRIKMFFVPYILLMIVIELAVMIYLSTKDSKPGKEKNAKLNRNKETFNGFYVDR